MKRKNTEFIEEIKAERLESGDDDEYVNMLKRLVEVFQSPTHWILEFIQNAEDVGATELIIRLAEDGLWIINDGDPFDKRDVKNICSVRSRKLPSEGIRLR